MSWSWRIGRVAGIPIYVHWTFLILLAWVAMAQLLRGQGPAAAAEAVGVIAALFGCVVLHELGHALAARRYGIPTADITLLPIGGVARLQRMPEHPGQELVVALAGPAVNVAIAAVLLAAGVRATAPGVDDAGRLADVGFFANLLAVNVMLVLFNLLPAFPMDGGRVLRALLAMRLEYVRATRIAASVGQLMAIGFALLGLLAPNPMLMLIALFVWIGAEAEAQQVEQRVLLKGVPVRQAMLTDFATLSPGDTLGRTADLLLAGSQQDFPVLSDGDSSAVLTRASLLAGLAERGREAKVADYATPGGGTVEADSPLVPALARLREGEGPCLHVVERGKTVGLLTLENVAEFVMIRNALGGSRPPRPAPAVPRLGTGTSPT